MYFRTIDFILPHFIDFYVSNNVVTPKRQRKAPVVSPSASFDEDDIAYVFTL
jgi:hypothetical protein